MVHVLKEGQLCLIKGKNAADSKAFSQQPYTLWAVLIGQRINEWDPAHRTSGDHTGDGSLSRPSTFSVQSVKSYRQVLIQSISTAVSDWGGLHCTFLLAHRLPAAIRSDVEIWVWLDKSHSVNAIFVFQMRMASISLQREIAFYLRKVPFCAMCIGNYVNLHSYTTWSIL